MLRTSLAALALTLLASMPAYAVLCTDSGGTLSFSYEENGQIRIDEQARNEHDMQMLRERGVDAVRVERWGTCIRAYVRLPDGTEEMQFFNPGSYRRAY
ncbi:MULTISPECIES: hypothetical protein [Devosia]|uniref:hypothetical protein n=1 Tax=Devosia TaxID=46913 RepID=UPI002733EE73|nr:hypothetical protein [Devosia sp.]MDP2781569.1 hypothetical protein [Devosia sp.]HLV84631.1 hypothetical protein [Devosia sp.]